MFTAVTETLWADSSPEAQSELTDAILQSYLYDPATAEQGVGREKFFAPYTIHEGAHLATNQVEFTAALFFAVYDELISPRRRAELPERTTETLPGADLLSWPREEWSAWIERLVRSFLRSPLPSVEELPFESLDVERWSGYPDLLGE